MVEKAALWRRLATKRYKLTARTVHQCNEFMLRAGVESPKKTRMRTNFTASADEVVVSAGIGSSRTNPSKNKQMCMQRLPGHQDI